MKCSRIFKIIAITIAALVALVVVSFFVYILDYYHADDSAKSALQSPQSGISVKILKQSDIAFLPDNPNGKGLVFYPGGKVEYTAYVPLMEKLARCGITCVLVKVPFNLAFLDVDAAEDAIKQVPGVSEWYVGGHSLGGVAASLFVYDNPGLFEGIVYLGSYSSKDLSDTSVRILSIYGENDRVINIEALESARNNYPMDFTEIVIPGGCHAGFGSYGAQKGDGAATISSDMQQEISADMIVSWMN